MTNTAYHSVANVWCVKLNSMRLLFFSILCLLLLCFAFYNFGESAVNLKNWQNYKSLYKVFNKEDDGYCYDLQVNTTSSDYLQVLDPGSVGKGSIFFVETRCHAASLDILTKRQACSVESAAFTNSHSNVYVLFPSAVPFSPAHASPYLQQLLKYPNVKLRRVTMAEYIKGSPIEAWYAQGLLRTSKHRLVHMSDVLRLLTLWKFGGIYLDLDIITLRSLRGLGPFAAIANDKLVGNAVIGSSRRGIGHRVLTMALEELTQVFQGDIWGRNGPILVTDVLRNVCELEPEEPISSMDKVRCKGFNVYPAKFFHPLPYYSWHKYFSNGTEADKTMRTIRKSYTVHMWNKMSHATKVAVESEQPYSILAKRYCPLVYKNVGDDF